MDKPPSYESIMNQNVLQYQYQYQYQYAHPQTYPQTYPQQTYIYTAAYPKENHNKNVKLIQPITKPKNKYKEESFGCCILL